MSNSRVQTTGKKIISVDVAPVPDFQALPSSISSAQFVQPTQVEYFPKHDEDLPEVDLKGHTIEELATAANVSIDTIKAAIKLRQQQMLVDMKTTIRPKSKKATTVTTTSVQPSESIKPINKLSTQSTTTRPIATSYVTKKKATRKTIKNGHKVRNWSEKWEMRNEKSVMRFD